MGRKVRLLMVLCLLLLLALPASGLAQPSVLSAAPGRLLLDGWEMVLPEIEGPYAKNPSLTVFKYTRQDGTVQRFAMKPPAEVPVKWTKRGTKDLPETPPGYPKEYSQQLNDWWLKGGRGNYLNKNGAWVRTDQGAGTAAPPSPEPVVQPDEPRPNVPVVIKPPKTEHSPSDPTAQELAKQVRDCNRMYGAGDPRCQAAYKAYVDYISNR